MTDEHIDIATAWTALGGEPSLLPEVSTVVREGALAARLPVRELARACVGACALAGAEWGARRAGLARAPEVTVDDGAVATAFQSERHLRVDGRATSPFAPLSRFWRTADGWVRTHANYPHHRARLLGALGLTADAAPQTVEAALAERPALEVEETVCAAGGLAVALRTPGEWAAHEQGRALRARPLVERERLDDAPARAPLPLPETPLLPMAGLRVLDLTRVIAGPVSTRALALLGADVLRIDSPRLPEIPDQHLDMDFGKRSTTLDLTAPGDRAAFEDLLASADVLVTGYRPGALDRLGLSAPALAERRPGLVVAQLSAWGAYGPWGGRRGFDSLVQVATGIAVTEGTADGRPGALPPRRWTTARDTSWRRPSCGPSPTRRSGAVPASSASRWRGRRPGWQGTGPRRAARSRRARRRPTRTPRPGSRRRTAGPAGCGTPCRRCASRAPPRPGTGRRGPGAPTRPGGAEGTSGGPRGAGRGEVRDGAVSRGPYPQ